MAGLIELREAYADLLDAEASGHPESVREARDRLGVAVGELLGEHTNVQALALARLIRDQRVNHVDMRTHVFDLPDGYWHATLNGTFVCGIAPDGSVSS